MRCRGSVLRSVGVVQLACLNGMCSRNAMISAIGCAGVMLLAVLPPLAMQRSAQAAGQAQAVAAKAAERTCDSGRTSAACLTKNSSRREAMRSVSAPTQEGTAGEGRGTNLERNSALKPPASAERSAR